MMEALHFLRPWWLSGIPLGLAWLWWLYRRRAAGRGIWMRIVDPALRSAVLVGGDEGVRRWPWLLAAGAVVSAATALSGPSWQRVQMPADRAGDAMVIALDLSRSMDATDVTPSRLTRARLKLLDILRERASGETALVVYSANAFVVTPLTEDTQTIATLVPTLTTDLMPSRGSYPEAAIVKGVQLLDQADAQSGRILLIADGGNMPPAVSAARAAREAGHSVSVLAVGTEAGGPIPERRGGFVTDSRGAMALPKLPASALRRLASAGGGSYAALSVDGRDLVELDVKSRATRAPADSDQQQALELWADQGYWFLLPLLALAALAFRRGGPATTLALVLVCMLPATPAAAWQLKDLWWNDDQQAAAALADGDAEAAAELFEDPAWRAAALYRGESFAQSAQQFAALDGVTARFNEGNALARQGKYAAAIERYEAVLDADPAHEDAAHNLELLREAMQQQSGAGESSEGGNEGESQPQQGGEQAADSNAEGASAEASAGNQAGDAEATPAEPDTADQQQDIEALQQALRDAAASPDDAQAEEAELAERSDAEQEQAMEQWLRRVPDDPGGLLRRKFRYQYQRRQLDQDGNALWPDDRAEPW